MSELLYRVRLSCSCGMVLLAGTFDGNVMFPGLWEVSAAHAAIHTIGEQTQTWECQLVEAEKREARGDE